MAVVLSIALMFDEISSYFRHDYSSVVSVDTRPLEQQHHIQIGIALDLIGMDCSCLLLLLCTIPISFSLSPTLSHPRPTYRPTNTAFGFDVMDVTGELQLNAAKKFVKEPLSVKGRATPGCRMYGMMEAHRVDGEFHIAFGKIAALSRTGTDQITATQKQAMGHIHRFTYDEMISFNASHVIRHLQFGDATAAPIIFHKRVPHEKTGKGRTEKAAFRPFHGNPAQPLNGKKHVVPKNAARFVYHIKVVPVLTYHRDGSLSKTYEYTYYVCCRCCH